MQVPLQLTFRSMTPSDALAMHVRLRTEKLEHICDSIVSCHVVVQLAGHHHRHGDRFHVSINLNLPGHELLVGHAPAEDSAETAEAATDQAFDDAARQLEDWMKRRRGERHDEGRTRQDH